VQFLAEVAVHLAEVLVRLTLAENLFTAGQVVPLLTVLYRAVAAAANSLAMLMQAELVE
jgi:hypothetical protein